MSLIIEDGKNRGLPCPRYFPTQKERLEFDYSTNISTVSLKYFSIISSTLYAANVLSPLIQIQFGLQVSYLNTLEVSKQ